MGTAQFRSIASAEDKDNLGLGQGRVLTFTSVTGGTGKSSLALIAANILNSWAASQSQSVLLVDACLDLPSLLLLGLKRRPYKDMHWAVSQIDAGQPADEVLPSIVSPLAAGESDSNKKILAATGNTDGGFPSNLTLKQKAETLYDLVIAAARQYDYVIVDAPAIDPTTTEMSEQFVLPVSDSLLFVCDSDYTSSTNTVRHYSALTKHHAGKGLEESAVFVYNRIGEHSGFNMGIAVHWADGDYGQPIRALGGVPYEKDLRSRFGSGHYGTIPEIASVNKAVASILEQALELPAGAIADSLAFPAGKSGRGVFSRVKTFAGSRA